MFQRVSTNVISVDLLGHAKSKSMSRPSQMASGPSATFSANTRLQLLPAMERCRSGSAVIDRED
ncbi:unnamed protein product [Clonostachys rosea]|uniref:Uncharacterized protein n=1 Tax=Bionectria ochroleuca TaxID=29856 RepID=A0ABY6V0L4_BIOOC|nr:unnamed protein product [Clonostachys rosea]